MCGEKIGAMPRKRFFKKFENEQVKTNTSTGRFKFFLVSILVALQKGGQTHLGNILYYRRGERLQLKIIVLQVSASVRYMVQICSLHYTKAFIVQGGKQNFLNSFIHV